MYHIDYATLAEGIIGLLASAYGYWIRMRLIAKDRDSNSNDSEHSMIVRKRAIKALKLLIILGVLSGVFLILMAIFYP